MSINEVNRNVDPIDVNAAEYALSENELEQVSGGTGAGNFTMFELVDIPKCLNCGAKNVRGRVTTVGSRGTARVTTFCCNRDMSVSR